MRKTNEMPPRHNGCLYCKHVSVIELDPRTFVSEEYCCQNKDANGKAEYARITTNLDEIKRMEKKGIKSINGFVSCRRFESSGIGARSETIEYLVQFNPRCKSIPPNPEQDYITLYYLLIEK